MPSSMLPLVACLCHSSTSCPHPWHALIHGVPLVHHAPLVHAAPLVRAASSMSHPHPRRVPSFTWATPHRTLDPCPFMSHPTLLRVTHTLISGTTPAASLSMCSGHLHVSCPCLRHLLPCRASVSMHPGHALCHRPHYPCPGPFLHASNPPSSCQAVPRPCPTSPCHRRPSSPFCHLANTSVSSLHYRYDQVWLTMPHRTSHSD